MLMDALIFDASADETINVDAGSEGGCALLGYSYDALVFGESASVSLRTSLRHGVLFHIF